MFQVIPSNFQIRGMHTIIRDHTTHHADFVFYADRLLRLVCARVRSSPGAWLACCGASVPCRARGLGSGTRTSPLVAPLGVATCLLALPSRTNRCLFLGTLQVVEAGLGYLPFSEKIVLTPTGHQCVCHRVPHAWPTTAA